jgi:hypothetical protein
MEKIINAIFETVKDYRSDEGLSQVKMSPERIKKWVEQFEEQDREFILTELRDVLDERYYPKTDCIDFLSKVIDRLTKDLKYETSKDFLNETIFLDLQEEGKSQKVMLKLMTELLKEKYSFDISKCGSAKMKNFVYLDDVLCTGNTLFRDIETWAKAEYQNGKTNQDVVEDGTIKLILAFIITHDKNYYKKISQIKRNISEIFSRKISSYHLVNVLNKSEDNSMMDFIFPLASKQPQSVLDYQESITKLVDEYSKGKYVSPEEYYRPEKLPTEEKFFSSKENRQRFENILLNKGIEILSKANTNLKNMRALGYSLPSFKDLGFGALCFTWRNVPNNTPLVFWYSGGGFTPLFNVNRGNSSEIKIISITPSPDKSDNLPF